MALGIPGLSRFDWKVPINVATMHESASDGSHRADDDLLAGSSAVKDGKLSYHQYYQ